MSVARPSARGFVTAYASWHRRGLTWTARIGRTECTIRRIVDETAPEDVAVRFQLTMTRPGFYDRIDRPSLHEAQVYALETLS